MDNMKNGGHAGTAEAENAETMDLLTGMLDAATHCGDNDGDGKEPARQRSGREYAKITAKPTRCCDCKTGKGDSISPLFLYHLPHSRDGKRHSDYSVQHTNCFASDQLI